MNPESQLNASMWLMIVIQTVGAIDIPGHGKPKKGENGKLLPERKLPAPKVYVATIVLWSIFGLIADAGQGKAAAMMSWVTTLTAMVIGPFGGVLAGSTNAQGVFQSGLLQKISQIFGTAQPTSTNASQGATLV